MFEIDWNSGFTAARPADTGFESGRGRTYGLSRPRDSVHPEVERGHGHVTRGRMREGGRARGQHKGGRGGGGSLRLFQQIRSREPLVAGVGALPRGPRVSDRDCCPC